MNLTKKERKLQAGMAGGHFKSVGKKEVNRYNRMFRKDANLNMRVNSGDLMAIKEQAAQHGMPYQTYINSWLHKLATKKLKASLFSRESWAREKPGLVEQIRKGIADAKAGRVKPFSKVR